MKNEYKTTGYYLSNGRGGDYHTKSIVKARAYAVRMIQAHPEWSWWDIYGGAPTKKHGKPYTTVVYLGPRLGYVWSHDGVRVRMYTDGRLKRRLRA